MSCTGLFFSLRVKFLLQDSWKVISQPLKKEKLTNLDSPKVYAIHTNNFSGLKYCSQKIITTVTTNTVHVIHTSHGIGWWMIQVSFQSIHCNTIECYPQLSTLLIHMKLFLMAPNQIHCLQWFHKHLIFFTSSSNTPLIYFLGIQSYYQKVLLIGSFQDYCFCEPN